MILDSKQIRNYDNYAINKLKIPGIVLMEQAGIKCFNKISKIIDKKKIKNVYIFAGKGNNGGDGYVVARHLFFKYNTNINIKVFVSAKYNEIKNDAKTNLDILKNLKLNISYITSENQIKNLCKNNSLIIDSLLGTGIVPPVKGIISSIINYINNLKNKFVVSIDIPSGIDGNTGILSGSFIKPDITLTIGAYKQSFFLYPTTETIGGLEKIKLIKINLDLKIKKNEYNIKLLEKKSFRKKESIFAHKGNNGKILIIAGSEQYPGAAYLSGLSAFKSGAGMVYYCVPDKIKDFLNIKLPESIIYNLESDINGQIKYSENNINKIKNIIKKNKFDAIILGPGLGISDDLQKLISIIINLKLKNLIVDADGLNNLSKIKFNKLNNIILTPHPAEFSRLINEPIDKIQNNRFLYTKQFCKKYKCILILKGHFSIIANDKQIFVNTTGNEKLAIAGSGDLLTGIIASTISKNNNQFKSAADAVYLHGKISDYIKTNNIKAILASEIINYFNEVINEPK